MTKYYNEMEQSWRKLKETQPEVAKAIEESDDVECLQTLEGTWEYCNNPCYNYGAIYRAPIPLTPAEKFLEKWQGKKICLSSWGNDEYAVPTGELKDEERFKYRDEDGDYDYHHYACVWQLWEPPKVKLDTRLAAGWWCHDDEEHVIKMITCVNEDGGVMESAENPLQYKYSKDPMLPLSEWKTLEQICAEAER